MKAQKDIDIQFLSAAKEKMIDADSKVIFNNKKYERRNPIAQLTLEF